MSGDSKDLPVCWEGELACPECGTRTPVMIPAPQPKPTIDREVAAEDMVDLIDRNAKRLGLHATTEETLSLCRELRLARGKLAAVGVLVAPMLDSAERCRESARRAGVFFDRAGMYMMLRDIMAALEGETDG